MDTECAFCQRHVATRQHHIIPRCKGGRETAPTCRSCEDFIHNSWTHNQLRDDFNTIEKIQADPRYQNFLKWLLKQKATTDFRSDRNRARSKRKYH